MHEESKLEQVYGVPQLFVKKYGNRIELLVAKVIDDLIVSGRKDMIESFVGELKDAFDVGKISMDGGFK